MTHKIFKYVLAFLGLAIIFPLISMGQQADLEEKELHELIGEGLEAAVELGTLSEEDAEELFRELTDEDGEEEDEDFLEEDEEELDEEREELHEAIAEGLEAAVELGKLSEEEAEELWEEFTGAGEDEDDLEEEEAE